MRPSVIFASLLVLAAGCGIDEVPPGPPDMDLDVIRSTANMVAPDFFVPGDQIKVALHLSGPPPLAAHTPFNCRDAFGNPKPALDLTIGAGIIPLNDDGTENPSWKSRAVYSGVIYEAVSPAEQRSYDFGPITVPDYRKTGLPNLSKVKVVTLTAGYVVKFETLEICTATPTQRYIRERVYEFNCGASRPGDFSHRCGYRPVPES